jgi:YD repeat-containing protein
METVGDGTNTATYSYLANSTLMEDIAFTQNATARMTTTKSYDYLNRLASIGHTDPQSATLASFAYGYNAANQRTNLVHANGDHWSFGYDELGQVSSGKKRNSADNLFPGLQYEYDYDDIGNRLVIKGTGT